MTTRQRLELRCSEIRTRLNDLAALDEPSADELAEIDRLTVEYRAKETQLRAAIASDEPQIVELDDAQGNEMRSMLADYNIGAKAAFVVEGRAMDDGSMQEVDSHYGLQPNEIPVDYFRVHGQARAERRREERAITPAPSDVGANQAEILPPPFVDSNAPWLGFAMPSVGVGESVYPVLVSRPTVGGPHDDSTDVDETTGNLVAETLRPSRYQAGFSFRRVDAALLRGMNDALTTNLNAGFGEKVGQVCETLLFTDIARTDASAVDTYSSTLKRLVYDLIDGRITRRESDLRLLAGQPTNSFWSTLYRAAAAGDMNAVEKLRMLTGGLRVSAFAPPVASDKQDVIVRRSMRSGEAVFALWQGISLIRDEVTRAGQGEIKVTAVLLGAAKIIRAAGYSRIQTQHE